MLLQTPDWNPTILEDAGINEGMVKNLGTELEGYLSPYLKCIHYAGQESYVENYTKGLLSDLEYKSAEPIALRYGMSVRGMQRFLKDGKWDTEMMLGTYQEKLSSTISHPKGMITIDGCGNPKKGNNSVGVARQYCGATGKTDNCQTGVFIGYSGPKGYGLQMSSTFFSSSEGSFFWVVEGRFSRIWKGEFSVYWKGELSEVWKAVFSAEVRRRRKVGRVAQASQGR
jgi:hypothetical protein